MNSNTVFPVVAVPVTEVVLVLIGFVVIVGVVAVPDVDVQTDTVLGDSHFPDSCAVIQYTPEVIQLGPPPVQFVVPPAQLYKNVLVAVVVTVVNSVFGLFGP